MEKKFRSAYADRIKVSLDTGSESQVQQNAKDECDVNKILEKFNRTGQLPNMIKKDPQYGDFADASDYHEALNMVIFAQEQFQGLSSRVRNRFANDPEKFLAFVNDPKNAKEMQELGLTKSKPVSDSPASNSVPADAGTPKP